MSDDIHALSGAYAVDALDDTERAIFEKHLAACETCQIEVSELQETAVTLADAVAVTPPSHLRERVLTQITTVRPLPPVTSIATRRRRWFTGILVAAAAVIAIGIGVTTPWSSDSPEPLSAVDQVVQADDTKAVETALAPGGRVTLYVAPSLDRAAMAVTDLPPLPEGKVYQVWLANAEGSMVPAGLVPEGISEGSMVLDGTTEGITGAGITIEPTGGSPEPTTDPIALIELA